MAYQFRLRALLRLRRIYEQRERMRLSLLHASRQRARDECDTVARERLDDFERLEERLELGMPGRDFQARQAELHLKAEHQQGLADLLEALQVQILQQTTAFQQAQTKRKMLESMDERERQAYELIQARREQQRIDDLFASRRRRPSSG